MKKEGDWWEYRLKIVEKDERLWFELKKQVRV